MAGESQPDGDPLEYWRDRRDVLDQAVESGGPLAPLAERVIAELNREDEHEQGGD